jgi:hypothetical protein
MLLSTLPLLWIIKRHLIISPSLIGNYYLDNLTPAYSKTLRLLGLNMAISGLKDTTVVLASFPMTLIPCV